MAEDMNYQLKNRNELIHLFNSLKFKYGAEVGVGQGKFSKFMHDTIHGLKLFSVDKPREGREKYYVAAKQRLARYPLNTLIVDSSMNAVGRIENKSLDFVYIDADHTFNYVVCDIVEWSKKVRDGGIVSGHDYMKRRGWGVIDAVNLYCKHNNKELLLTEDKGSRGHSWYFYK